MRGAVSGSTCLGMPATIAIHINPAAGSVSFVLGQVPVNKEHEFEVSIPIKDKMEEPIALALGLLKQVV